MPCKHAAAHDEIGAAAERLCEVAGACATAIADNMAAETMRGVGTFHLWASVRGIGWRNVSELVSQASLG